MSDIENRDQLRQAVTLIKAGDMGAAREILRSLCEGGSADAWWLLAQTTQNSGQVRIALQKSLEIDPQHERALQQFAKLFPGEQPEINPPAPVGRKPKEKAKGSPAFAHGLRLVITALGGLVIGLSIFVLFRLLTYTLPPPVFGPYYQRYMYPYIKEEPQPCAKFLVFGQVKNGAGMVAHAWVRDYDQQITTDTQGGFQFTLPKESIVYEHQPNGHFTGDVPVKFQLLNANGEEQSGINHLYFLGGCAVYIEYWHEETGGLKFGSADERPPSWNGPYDVSYSGLTTTPLLVCDFTGFTGTAYDDNGPMKDMVVQIVNTDDHSAKPNYFVTDSGSLEGPMGPSWWYLFAEPDHRYVIQVINPLGTIIITDIIYLPPKQGCDSNLIKVSIMQAERRDGTPPPTLPAGWETSG